jgi:LysM repeat protein
MNLSMTRPILWLLLVLGLAAPVFAGPDPNGAVFLAGQPPNVVVGPGDTLSRLGLRFRLDPAVLARANGLSGPQAALNVGQVLAIPALATDSGLRRVGPNHAAALASLPPAAQLNHLGTPRIVLADYMAWYNPTTFDGTQTFDLPAAGPYYSSDLSTVRRQLAQAKQACLDGFTVHWYGPFDPVTTNNFNLLLKASATTNMQHALVLLTNMWPGATEETLITAIQYIIDHWAYSPYFMKIGGRPLLLFTDMSRPWNGDVAALAAWTRIRAATDPDHKLIWMAEGLFTNYNPLFDGLYIYRIDHRDYPQSWLKQPRFANLVRAAEYQYQGSLPLGGLYFADTIAPGYDDTRAGNVPADLRSPAPPFARDRADGAYYAETFAVTSQTNGDFLLVKSFNEWVEGTAIEPSVTYGDRYLDLTCQYANEYRTR